MTERIATIHRLNNLLQDILGDAQLLQLHLQEDSAARRRIDKICDNVARVAALVSELEQSLARSR